MSFIWRMKACSVFFGTLGQPIKVDRMLPPLNRLHVCVGVEPRTTEQQGNSSEIYHNPVHKSSVCVWSRNHPDIYLH